MTDLSSIGGNKEITNYQRRATPSQFLQLREIIIMYFGENNNGNSFHFSVAGISSVSRDCQAIEDVVGCIEMNVYGAEGTQCACSADKCNNSPTASVVSTQSFALILISSFALIRFIWGN